MLVTCAKCNSHVDTGELSPGEILTCRCGLGIMVPEPPASAGKMGCPSCGAPVDPELKVCGFCDTALATVLCPTCFGVVFDGAKHCSLCGAVLTRAKVIHHGDETQRLCPRCEAHPHMRVEVVAGCPIDRCPDCEGLWIETEVVERMYKDRENAPSIQAMAASDKQAVQPTGTGALKPEGYIQCPDCGKLMNRQNFGRFSGVIIDSCKAHGTWFDADELRRIIEFIHAGGLQKQAQREREELQEELRQLRSKARGEAQKANREIGSMSGGGARILGGTSAIGIASLLRKLL